jgi:hypothetical protein
MANTRIIRNITEALLNILRSDLVPSVMLDNAAIKAAPPEDIEDITDETLILYLYQVIESPFLKNVGPHVKTLTPTVQVERDPLALDLYYLLIPGAPTTTQQKFLDTYDILGAAMRSFHDHGIFTLGDWVPLGADQVDQKDFQFRVAFNRLETSDLIRIWEAVHRSYRLSVSYVVRTAQIDSQLITDTRLVSERRLRIGASS